MTSFCKLMMKNLKKNGVGVTICNYCRNSCPMVALSGLYQSPAPPPLGNARSIVPVHCHGDQNGQQSWSIFSLLFCLLLPWQPPGQYGESSHPMAATSGFRVALDMLHQAMPSVLLYRAHMAIKMAHNGGAFVSCCHLFCLI